MNYVKKSLIVAAIMMPLSLLAMDAEKNEKKPLFEPLVSNGKYGFQLGGEFLMEPHDLEAAQKAQGDTMIDRYVANLMQDAVIHESDFDLTGDRLGTRPAFPPDIKDEAKLAELLAAFREIAKGFGEAKCGDESKK